MDHAINWLICISYLYWTLYDTEQQKIGQKINVFVYKLILMDNVFV